MFIKIQILAMSILGASSDPRDVANCYNPNYGYESYEPTTTTETINGIEFRKFHFGGRTLHDYLSGNSFRVVHNNICYAIEQIETGSQGLPGIEELSKKSITVGNALAEFYDQTSDIIKTFKFTK